MRDLQAARRTPLTPTDAPPPGAPPPGDPAPPKDASPPPVPPRRRGLLAAAALTVLALDLATKTWAVRALATREIRALGGLVVLHVTRNPGAAFSLGGDATVLLTLVALGVAVAILRAASRLRSRGWALALGLLLGGATGNLADRLFRSPGPLRGRVVDFVDLHYAGRSVWPVFNVADMAIVTGAALALLLAFRGVELDGSRRDAGDTEP